MISSRIFKIFVMAGVASAISMACQKDPETQEQAEPVEEPSESEILAMVRKDAPNTATVKVSEVIIDKTNKRGHYFAYSGNTGVLNGVPYTISAKWDY